MAALVTLIMTWATSAVEVACDWIMLLFSPSPFPLDCGTRGHCGLSDHHLPFYGLLLALLPFSHLINRLYFFCYAADLLHHYAPYDFQSFLTCGLAVAGDCGLVGKEPEAC